MSFVNSTQWQSIKRIALSDRKDLIESLVQKDSDEVRGRIKQIDDVLEIYPGQIARKLKETN